MKKAFYLPLKTFLFLKYLNFCADVFGYVRKGLNERPKVNLKIYYVINWETNIFNIHIAQYPKR